MAEMLYRLEQLLMNISFVGLQTYFQTFWFYEHLAERILFKRYPHYF